MRWLAITVLVIGASPCAAQVRAKERTWGTFSLEFAGNALFGATVNAEVFLRRRVALRAGTGLDFYSQTTVFPLQVVLLSGTGSSSVEVAAGITVAHEATRYPGTWLWDGTKTVFGGFLGYRYQRPHRFLLRIGVVPLLWTNAHLPWFSVGIGSAF